MKKIIIGIAFVYSFVGYGQTTESAINFGMNSLVGSARYVGMGGAFTAVGGDLSSVKINPAGAGQKRKDEFSITGLMSFQMDETSANGVNANNETNKFSIPEINYLSVNPTTDRYWKTINFGIGINRINNLNGFTSMEGNRVEKSYITELQNRANSLKDNGIALEPNDWAYQAFQTYLLDTNEKQGFVSPLESEIHNYNYERETNGKIYDISFTVSSAYKNKLFIGGTLSFPILNFESYSSLTENGFLNPKLDWNVNGSITNLESAQFETIHSLTGTGINAKIGLIYRMNPKFRVGFSIHTPTLFNIENLFSYRTTASYQGLSNRVITHEGVTYYDLIIPATYNLGTAFVFGKKGLISLDYSFRDLSGSRYVVPKTDVNYDYFYGNEDENYQGVNNVISSSFGGAHTIRVGGELNFKPFRFRGGFAHQTSPSNLTENYKSTSLTLGMGYSRKEFTCDIAFANTQTENSVLLSPYETTTKGRGDIATSINQFILTFGFKVK